MLFALILEQRQWKMMTMNKSYRRLIWLSSFQERFDYLKCDGSVGDYTFGGHRYLNQLLYNSQRWKKVRNEVIIRDNGFDLAHRDYPIGGNIYVHHINPITIDDILEERSCVFDPDNLVSTSFQTHNAIHYGNEQIITREPVTRKPYDTCPWKR